MIPLDAERAGRALGIRPLAATVGGISIDSRSLRPGDLFIALRGERFDGHNYVEAAFAAGAVGAVVERTAWRRRSSYAGEDGVARAGEAAPSDQADPAGRAALSGEVGASSQATGPGKEGDRREVTGPAGVGGPVYEVDDTLAALWALAREVRRLSRATVFAITGSVGKTSTKDLLKAMVGRVHRVVATAGNQNNEVGVPLTLLAIDPDTEAVIVEMGMRGRGQIEALARVAEPDIGVITNIHPVHLELLGTLEAVAEAKAELMTGVASTGAAVVPYECEVLRCHTEKAACRLVRFGVGRDLVRADVRGWVEEGMTHERRVLVLSWPEGEARLETSSIPQHRVENVVAAAAACYASGLPLEACAAGIAEVRYTGGRGDVLEVGDLCIIDDTYNANPAAVRAALDGLVSVAATRGGRPVAVLGDMLELGPDSVRFHEEVGAYAAQVGVEVLWGVGPLSRATVEGFRRAHPAERSPGGGTPGSAGSEGSREPGGASLSECSRGWAAGHLASPEETSTVRAALRPGDVVLFKASRSIRLEHMVRAITIEVEAGMER